PSRAGHVGRRHGCWQDGAAHPACEDDVPRIHVCQRCGQPGLAMSRAVQGGEKAPPVQGLPLAARQRPLPHHQV
ncbi:hypothetical protein H4R19_003028, partial [Coemansia spiralis]